MSEHQPIDKATTLGHTCFFYEDEQDRTELLVKYFEQGVANNELCIFVTADTVEDAVYNFGEYNEPLVKAYKDGALRIFEMNNTYIRKVNSSLSTC